MGTPECVGSQSATVYFRATGGGDYAQFYSEFCPVDVEVRTRGSGSWLPPVNSWLPLDNPWPPWPPPQNGVAFFRYFHSSGSLLIYPSPTPYNPNDPPPDDSAGYGILVGQSVTIYSPPFPSTAIPPQPPGTRPNSQPSWGNYAGYWASFNPVTGGGLRFLGYASPDWSGGYPTNSGDSTPRSGNFSDSGGGYTLLISDSRGLVFTKEYDSPIEYHVVCDCEEDCLPVYSNQQSDDFLCICSGNADNDDLEAMKERIKQELKAELPPIIKDQVKAELIPELGPLIDAKIDQKFTERMPELITALSVDTNFMFAFADILATNQAFILKLKEQVDGIT